MRFLVNTAGSMLGSMMSRESAEQKNVVLFLAEGPLTANGVNGVEGG